MIEKGNRVVLSKRKAADTGTVRELVEPKPGWHRALVQWDIDRCEQFVDVDQLEKVDTPPRPLTLEELCDELGIETADLETLRREREEVAKLIGYSSAEIAAKLRAGELAETEHVDRWLAVDAMITVIEQPYGKCARTVCENAAADLVHRDTGERYCVACARRINEHAAAADGVVDLIAPPKEEA